MKHLKTRIKQFYKDTKDIVLLPDMNQSCGYWNDENKIPSSCCFGARIAKAYNIKYRIDGKTFSHRDGADEMQEKLNLGLFELDSLLWLCGAHFNPFGTVNWIASPEYVMNNLLKIERKPTESQFRDLKKMIKKLYNTCHDLNWKEREMKLKIWNSIT